MNILTNCQSTVVEKQMTIWNSELEELSKNMNVDRIFLERQLRLHIPQLHENQILQSKVPVNLIKIIETRLKSYNLDYKKYLSHSNCYYIGNSSNIRDNQISCNTDGCIDFLFKDVEFNKAKFIESKLHYLMSFRHDAIFRFGLFLKQSDYPFCYVSFTPINREYRLKILQEIPQNNLNTKNTINMARVYGYGNLPKNTISKLISLSSKKLKKMGYRVIMTSVNPYLGFNGKSIIASGFKPIAYVPVAYNYKANGCYITRRMLKEKEVSKKNLIQYRNLLFFKDLKKPIEKIKKDDIMITIDDNLFNENRMIIDLPISKQLDIVSLRNDLEQVWNTITRYDGLDYNYETDPISKGQCGVTAAFLSKKLEKQGFQVIFCEGIVKFLDNTPPINDHCWIKIKEFTNTEVHIENLIVDLTSDQTGFKERIICYAEDELKKKGVIYKSIKESPPKKIKSKGLISRLETLENRLEKLK
jgi:hypothetical protein